MNVAELYAAARTRLEPDVLAFFAGTAGGDPDRDTRAWRSWDLVPRVLTELTGVDARVQLGGETFASPFILAPVASQGACHPDGELATRRATAALGLLAAYSFHASIEVERFAAATDTGWWAQLYVMKDRTVSDGYLRRCAAAGATAVVLTVDVPGALADAPFRRSPIPASVARRGNHPGALDGGLTPAPETQSRLGPDQIRRAADISGLPVWVKGVMHPRDAVIAIESGAVGIFVSNHGRRQLDGVAPTASVLRDIVAAVGGSGQVVVDGGIRSGADVVRALALGADAAAIGRPIAWALAVGGQAQLERTLSTLHDEVVVAMAGVGAGRVADVDESMVQRALV